MINHPICIIDDDDDVRGVISFALNFEGIDTLPFESARKAEEYISKLSPENYPCLIIVDYTMPEMDGVEFIDLLSEKYPDTLGKIPVALSTAHQSDDILNIPDHVMRLQKPFQLSELMKMAKEYYSLPEKSGSF